MDLLGKQLGNYRLTKLLGKGGFAEVYQGFHMYLYTLAAVKVLHGSLTDEAREGFLKEARLIARLDHTHIVRIRDYGIEQSIPFIVMDYAPGGTIEDVCPLGSRMHPTYLRMILQQVADALQYAHNHGVVHRDIKPPNLLLTNDLKVLLSDFGLATISSERAAKDGQSKAGTWAYMAPEQFYGQPAKESDQYALGVTVYEWLSGRLPFTGTADDLKEQHLHTLPPALRTFVPDIPESVELVVSRALAKKPEERFQSVQAFATALIAALEDWQRREEQPRREEEQDDGKHIWNAPYPRNPFFTGRETVLLQIHEALQGGEAGLRVICGLGGIGKTQTAVEYACRFADAYHRRFFVHAETRETLLGDYLRLARLLGLLDPQESDQTRVVGAVKDWLSTHKQWLLILDNAEDLLVLGEFLPRSGQGHILVTTRAQVTGAASYIPLDQMFPEEALLFLLRRAGLIGLREHYGAIPNELRSRAQEIISALDGLPLALDQAGAFIEETHCTLDEYLKLYHAQEENLLEQRGVGNEQDHPEAVSATWALSFEKVELLSPAAADLLRLCAFLHCEDIPESLFGSPEADLGPNLARMAGTPLFLADIYATLRRYSLLRVEPQSVSIHRLVQTVLKERMDYAAQRLWAQRAIRAVSCSFPESENVAQWALAQRLIPQVDCCFELVEQWCFVSAEAAQLLNRSGLYLMDQARYGKAEVYLRKALAMRVEVFGHEGLAVAESLNDLGTLYFYQDRFADAEPYLLQSLALRERHQGPTHPETAIACNNLAALYRHQHQFEKAEELFRRALAVWQHLETTDQLDGQQANIARTVNNLSRLYSDLERPADAEALLLWAVALWEQLEGKIHPDLARTLNNLANLYHTQGRFAEAVPLLLRARTIREQAFGPDHPDVARTLADLAAVYLATGRGAEARSLFELALDILIETFGADHPKTQAVLASYRALPA